MGSAQADSEFASQVALVLKITRAFFVLEDQYARREFHARACTALDASMLLYSAAGGKLTSPRKHDRHDVTGSTAVCHVLLQVFREYRNPGTRQGPEQQARTTAL